MDNPELEEIKKVIKEAVRNNQKFSSTLIVLKNEYNSEIIDSINELLSIQFLQSQVHGKQTLLRQITRYLEIDEKDFGEKLQDLNSLRYKQLMEFLKREDTRLTENYGQ
jgi:hypothetical protein